MRLSTIKLAGFKSFAEATTLTLPGQLVGVVGPNGCGKSNIIDAVRWVLGESKASELRGESMQDVIFNGSGQRKPAARASVELVFDNTAARAGGQWNAYAEIAVKRTLTRDGTSSYYINQQPVRRRDVQDVFLGTGLGPRAYAIIGQGTISRIIESRPEELRLFLEEAAGVSKYKERRRETENRLKDTRDNLTRVEDILRELTSQLDKLESQAEAAGRWHALTDAATQARQRLWFMRQRDAERDAERLQRAEAAAENALQSRLSELRAAEARLDALRQSQYAANDTLHARQGALGSAALAVSRLEERIRWIAESRQRAQQRLVELRARHDTWTARRADADAALADLAPAIAAADADAARLTGDADAQAQSLPALDAAWRDAQAAGAQQRSEVAAVQQQLQLLAAEGRHADEQQRQLAQRRERLLQEQRGLERPDAARLEALASQEAAAVAARDAADAELASCDAQLPQVDDARRAAHATAQREAAKLEQVGARLHALRALQDKVRVAAKLQPWLDRQGLAGRPALWTRLHVEPGWENAVEAALRERLHALPVGRLDTLAGFVADPPPARLAFYADAAVAAAPAPAAAHALPRLASRLRVGDAALAALLDDWLVGVWCAESIESALAARAQLGAGETVLTRDGHAVGREAVAFYAADSEQAGMLARAQDIENLDREQRAQALIADEARAAAVRLDARYADAALRLQAARRAAAEAQQRAHAVHVERLRLTQQADAATVRHGRLDDELAEIATLDAALAERRDAAQSRFDALDAELATAQQRHAELDDATHAAERARDDARRQQRDLERRAHEAQLQARTLAARRDALQRDIAAATEQLAADADAAAALELEVATADDTTEQAALQQALAERLDAEQALGAARSVYDDLGLQMRRADEERLQHERSLDPLREQITRAQLDRQAAQLGAAQFAAQLADAGVDVAALARDVDAETDRARLAPKALQAEIDRLERDIAALGAVNLAALDELVASRERKAFLDAQNADLQDAIRTLEGAIHTIDVETRELLGDTFAQVDAHFGRMFPQLFGGGTARLVMTGGEILDAGVQVMAQPPGKKNSTIHLLSGGEKALAAIALVFAIFQLNPAPFCLLDEVDAPLDDANTDRYCKLVTEMSAGTQFLFISHNKIAMEMAEQLVGVTMQEQGVSRIVAVDLGAATRLAEAA